MLKLNLNTKLVKLLNRDFSEKIELDKQLNELQIIELISKYKNQKCEKIVFETIIHQYKQINDNIFCKVLKNNDSPLLANEIATSGKASENILKTLISHKSDSVKEHVELALLSKKLNGMSSEELENFYFKLEKEEYEYFEEAKIYFSVNPNTTKKVLLAMLNGNQSNSLIKIIKDNLIFKPK